MTRSCMLGRQSEVPVFPYLDGWNGDILCVCLVAQSACPVRWLAVARWGRLATNFCLGLTAPARQSIPVLTAAVQVSCAKPFLLQDVFTVFPEVVAYYVSIRFVVRPFMPHVEVCKFPTVCIFTVQYGQIFSIHQSIHLWRYSPFWALASLIRRLHSSLFAPLLLHPLILSSCSASLWITSAHLVLGLLTGLVIWKFLFRTFFRILSSSILIIWPAHSSVLILMSSTMFGSLYKL